ncbi:hypothetical protein CFD26_101323 [Aspergillus turcosus]|uniref:Uncharacterized protein n=1 Tax=Aspergillus turcosus TaxID=1245748 RepID=A0A3R7JEL6_9EURO|nr:hypothetical protein CFD26_101323 [Aspergillus turcosus]
MTVVTHDNMCLHMLMSMDKKPYMDINMVGSSIIKELKEVATVNMIVTDNMKYASQDQTSSHLVQYLIQPRSLVDLAEAAVPPHTCSTRRKLYSISVQIFAASDAEPLLLYSYTADSINATLGVDKVDENTVFRIGSVSKIWTILLFLIEKGFSPFQEPIANYIPELSAAVRELCYNSTKRTDKTDFVQWDEVTIGELASQLAGIARDYGVGDLAQDGSALEQLGFPALPGSEIPPCGIAQPCSRTRTYPTSPEFFNGLLQSHPIVPTSSTPVYSNAAFQILAYALETIAGQDYQNILEDRLIKPIGLTQSFYSTPSMKYGVIPDYMGEYYWDLQLGDETPVGGLYSSARDMAAVGRAILNKTLLPPAVTRRWMKPATHTSSLNYAVGAPWEILSFDYSRVIDLYTKSGDIGVYSATLVLSPDHDVGFTVLAAGNNTHESVVLTSDLIAAALIPALEQSAKDQARQRFAGTYALKHGYNSSITITTDEGPGLKVTSWISNSTNMFATIMDLEGLTDLSLVSVRLYPTGLKSPGQISFRAVIQQLPTSDGIGPFTSSCITWFTVDLLVYGNVGLDEFVFELNEKGDAGDDGTWKTVHELQVNPSDPSKVEQLARKDARNQNAIFYNKNLRKLTPAQCFKATIEDETNVENKIFMKFNGELVKDKVMIFFNKLGCVV